MHDPQKPYIPRIRPLPARHRNVQFASLTECRWGCCFSELGLAWQYQPQGYNIGNGRAYLADFWISEWRCYVEVKPDGIDLDVPIAVCRALARGSPYRVLLIVGAPGGDTYYVNIYGGRDGSDHIEAERGHFVECPRCDGFCVLGEYSLIELGPHRCRSVERAPLHTPIAAPRLFAAYNVAQNLDPRTSR